MCGTQLFEHIYTKTKSTTYDEVFLRIYAVLNVIYHPGFDWLIVVRITFIDKCRTHISEKI